MRHFRHLVFALTAFLWLPVSAHCQLEIIPGLEFLQCASDTPAAQGHCDDSGCCSAEKSECRIDQAPLALPSSEFQPATVAQISDVDLTNEVSVRVQTPAPPQLLQTWQFAFRTALPPRAPSLAS